MVNGCNCSEQLDLLIVEDRPVVRVMLREFVLNAFPECAIVDVANGTRAMEVLAGRSPRLVLMDVHLPDANGIALTARIRSEWPGIAVIVVSYLGAQAYVDAAKAAGAHAYVMKDRLTTDLVPAIAAILGVTPAGSAPGT